MAVKRRPHDSEKDLIKRLRRSGLTYDRIGEIVGFCASTVFYVCNPEKWGKQKDRREGNKTAIARRNAARYKVNREKDLADHAAYYAANREEIRARRAILYAENRDKRKVVRAAYRAKNIDKIRAYDSARHKKKVATDIQYKLRQNIRSRLHIAMKGNYKTGSATRNLGCTILELKTHLESLFKPGMTWGNHAHKGWHIDHIIPLSSFDLSDDKQLRLACHYSNLMPLWATENLRKGARIPEELNDKLQ